MPAPPAIETVCGVFGLSPFERAVLLMTAGVELDASFAALFNSPADRQHRFATFSLALAALPQAHWSALTPAAVPVPVSKQVLDALTDVTVTTPSEGASGFQLQFTLSNRSPLQTLFLVSGGSSIPLIRVLLIVTINGAPQTLIDGVPVHRGTDLEYIKQLASEVGYVFYVSPGPAPATSIAYWGPRVKVGLPQPALNLNMDAHTNVQSLSFNFNSQQKSIPVVYIQNEATKAPIPIPIPDITPLNPPLGLVPPVPLKIDLKNGTARLPPARAAAIGLAAASESSDVVTGSGTLDVVRYGRPLRARGLVGVRGVAAAFDGLYYVESVTDNLRRGSYTQNFNLSRNGLISTVPRVLP